MCMSLHSQDSSCNIMCMLFTRSAAQCHFVHDKLLLGAAVQCAWQCSQYELLYSVTLCMTSCYWELLYNVHDTLFTIWATVQCHFVCDKLLLGAAVQCAWHNVHNNSYRTVSVFTIIATVQCHFVRDKLLLGAAVQCAWHSVHNMLDTLLTGVEAPMDRPCSWWRMRSSRSWTPSEKMTLSTLWR